MSLLKCEMNAMFSDTSPHVIYNTLSWYYSRLISEVHKSHQWQDFHNYKKAPVIKSNSCMDGCDVVCYLSALYLIYQLILWFSLSSGIGFRCIYTKEFPLSLSLKGLLGAEGQEWSIRDRAEYELLAWDRMRQMTNRYYNNSLSKLQQVK